jgi:hypothetical protein
MLVGFIVMISGDKTERRRKIALFIIGLGFIIVGDDVIQHYIQYTNPGYRSPLHQLYGATLYKWEWMRKLNEWADKIF